jgi:peptide/nickel transport system substrate-binding protein
MRYGKLGRARRGVKAHSTKSRVKRLAAIATIVGFSALTGCGRATHPREPSVLRISEQQDPPGFNPLVTDNADLQDLVPMIHGFLLGTDARGAFTPDLVNVVPSVRNGGIAGGGRTIVYHLRHGVRWQDGAPFDAGDVVFSFNAAMNPRNDVPDRSGFDDVASVVARGPYTVVVTLRRPYSPALATFFSAGANDPYAILPAHLLAKQVDLNRSPYNALPVGLGPYRMTSWDRGSRVVLTADPSFRRGAPRIAKIEVTIVPDSNTALSLWQAGALDYLPVRGFSANRAMLAGARGVAGGVEKRSEHYQFNYLMFQVSRGPLRERAVREAIVRGVDGVGLENRVRGELNRPGQGDRLPGQFAYDSTIRQAPYDPAAARRLLDRANWHLQGGYRTRNGVPLAVEIVGAAGSGGSERLDVQLQAELTKLGIRSTIKTYQYNLLFASAQDGGIFAGGHFDLTAYGWQPGEDADHSYLFRCDTRPPNGENYGRICDPVIDRAAATEIESSDTAVQARADRAILRELDAQSDVLFLGFDREILFTRAGLRGLEPSVLGHHFWNVDRWAWAS